MIEFPYQLTEEDIQNPHWFYDEGVEAMIVESCQDGTLPEGFRVKVIDYGSAKTLKPGEEGKLGRATGDYDIRAPEMDQKGSYDLKADTWSLGVAYYQLLFNETMFTASNTKEDWSVKVKWKEDD